MDSNVKIYIPIPKPDKPDRPVSSGATASYPRPHRDKP